jgi:hypothetical protein
MFLRIMVLWGVTSYYCVIVDVSQNRRPFQRTLFQNDSVVNLRLSCLVLVFFQVDSVRFGPAILSGARVALNWWCPILVLVQWRLFP